MPHSGRDNLAAYWITGRLFYNKGVSHPEKSPFTDKSCLYICL
ncbi:hypothetical protein B4098_2969 [Heyndrickxia coagulans]|uniref:Uncharacterized protein n=1 Tax=Heyndrickxia coagulans TaxID=1398 RepID=A0A150KCZ5_HEYCO|nr:hypothetical protein B4098_2969 [Heyndrickxia coagulans]KYC67241.1 hypothetical protein B4099_3063 [Heyndrickxia coagulans]